MNLISLPDNYSGGYAELIYTLGDCDPEQVTDVEILLNNSDEINVIRRFTGETSYDINISNHIKQKLDVGPIRSQTSQIVNSTKRIVEAKIKTTDFISPSRIYTAGYRTTMKAEIMSDCPRTINIGPDEFDEISFIAPNSSITAKINIAGKDINKNISLSPIIGKEDVCTVMINIADILQKANIGDVDKIWHIAVEIYADNEIIITRNYELAERSTSATRICWINSYGAIDFYTFENLIDIELQAKKNRIYAHNGYKTYGCRTELVSTLKSDYEPRKTIEWLTEIVSSPAVWAVGREGFTEIDVITDSIKIKDQKPISMEIKVRPKLKTSI